MHGPDETVEGKVQRNFSPRRLFDRAKPRLRKIAKRHAGCGPGRPRQSEKTLVVDARETQAESAKIIGQEERALHF